MLNCCHVIEHREIMCQAQWLLGNGREVCLAVMTAYFVVVVVITWSHKLFCKIQLLLVDVTRVIGPTTLISWRPAGAVEGRGWLCPRSRRSNASLLGRSKGV